MSAFLPAGARGPETDPDHPRLLERDLDREERRARWAVRAAQWRAMELAEAVFGSVSDGSLQGLRASGAVRGLLVLRVPFDGLEAHRDRETRFLQAAAEDPVLSGVPLLYVFGADHG